MTEPEEIDLTEEEIDLSIDETQTVPTGPITPAWYESDDDYRPFCEGSETAAPDDADAYVADAEPEAAQ